MAHVMEQRGKKHLPSEWPKLLKNGRINDGLELFGRSRHKNDLWVLQNLAVNYGRKNGSGKDTDEDLIVGSYAVIRIAAIKHRGKSKSEVKLAEKVLENIAYKAVDKDVRLFAVSHLVKDALERVNRYAPDADVRKEAGKLLRQAVRENAGFIKNSRLSD